MDEKMRLEGEVQFLPFAFGSKSQGIRPFLVGEDGSKVLLYKEDDNPFENNGLRELNGQWVQVEGAFRGKTFCVEQVLSRDAVYSQNCSQEADLLKEMETDCKEADDALL